MSSNTSNYLFQTNDDFAMIEYGIADFVIAAPLFPLFFVIMKNNSRGLFEIFGVSREETCRICRNFQVVFDTSNGNPCNGN
ncbi:Protein CBG06785 [Caenorhabditis briggsae]|uniref:Protein CBG06785 n=1 Tax=Caenorhabditis briggsae TaxID=6238 RepID=A8X325_CAEBR|nr:Protein CBG06785 [Caenorhabditis briggsae]CAP27035.2 Protein CBG06785 [Caenorhabditis briggsae]